MKLAIASILALAFCVGAVSCAHAAPPLLCVVDAGDALQCERGVVVGRCTVDRREANVAVLLCKGRNGTTLTVDAVGVQNAREGAQLTLRRGVLVAGVD